MSEALKTWISNCGLPEESLALAVANQLDTGFGTDLFARIIIYPIYLTCFCEEGNLLSQWRAYGQSGGYCIGFKAFAEGPVLAMKPEPCVYTARWLKVEYDRALQIQRCKEILDSLLPALDAPELMDAVKQIHHTSPNGYQGLLNVISEMLMEESLAFKNKAFEVEREWRIVVRARELLKQGTDDGARTPVPIHFRSARGVLTPYIKLVPSNGTDLLSMKYQAQLPIESVRTGPRERSNDCFSGDQNVIGQTRIHWSSC